MTRLRDKIDDQVIERLTDLSYAAWRDGDYAESRKLADLAMQASLLGGTALGRAAALTQQAMITLDETQRNSAVPEEQLRAAELAAYEAAAIYAEKGQIDERVLAQLYIARLREARGDIFGALKSQLDSARLASESADPETRAGVFRSLCPLYWALPEERRYEGAELLVRDARLLVTMIADQETLGGLLDAAGDAHSQLGDAGRDAAFGAWRQAAGIYRDLNAAPREFRVCSQMFEYAARLGEAALARELGEACVAAAPQDAAPKQLAENYRLLGATYSDLDQADNAIAAYRQAINLHLGCPDGRKAASMLFLELGLIEADAGHYDDARRDLESVTSGSSQAYWLMETTLADICYQHLGDLGGAIAYARSALQMSISSLHNMLCRAYSLHQEAVLLARAGDMEAAYWRLSQLMPILAQHQSAEPIIIDISALCSHPVVLPSRAECARLASQVAKATGRHDEAVSYRQVQALFAGDDHEDILPAEYAADVDPYVIASLDIVKEIRCAMSLMPAHPQEALAVLIRARTVPAARNEPYLAAYLDYAEGSCHRLLHDFPAAAAAFERVLAIMPDGANADMRINCYQSLAFISAADRRYAESYKHLRKCVDLIERYRLSLPRAEDRIAFLRDQIPVYELLVISCSALNLRVEAFNAVQQMKSRSLGDLLAQPVHKPIDYALEKQATLLHAGREDWVAKYLRDTHSYNYRDPEEYCNSREYRMLTDSIERESQEKNLAEERLARGLLEELHQQATQVDFAAAKKLLRI